MSHNKEWARQYYLKNKEKINAQSKAYYKANKDKLNKVRATKYHDAKQPLKIFMVKYNGNLVSLSSVWAESDSTLSYPTVLTRVRDKNMSVDEALTKPNLRSALNRSMRKREQIKDMQELNDLWI